MKNWVKFLAFLTLPAIALIGCANTENQEPQDHYWQEKEETVEREVYRDK